MPKKKLSAYLYLASGILFILAGLLGGRTTFFVIGISFLLIGGVYYKKKDGSDL